MTLTDAAGRVWKVYDYHVIAGKSLRMTIGKGQYRGFAPVDGGARRTLLMRDAERARELTRETLLDQLSRSVLFHRDDPTKTASWGGTPERVDPTD